MRLTINNSNLSTCCAILYACAYYKSECDHMNNMHHGQLVVCHSYNFEWAVYYINNDRELVCMWVCVLASFFEHTASKTNIVTLCLMLISFNVFGSYANIWHTRKCDTMRYNTVDYVYGISWYLCNTNKHTESEILLFKSILYNMFNSVQEWWWCV